MTTTKNTNPKDAASSNRVPLWLLSPVAKVYWAMAHFAGMLKYGAWNWRSAGVRASVYTAAIQRHLDKWVSGEEHDEQDMTHHLGNIMACCAILLDARQCGKLVDDRPPSVDLGELYSEAETTADILREQYKEKSPRHWTKADTGECFGAPAVDDLTREAQQLGLYDAPKAEVYTAAERAAKQVAEALTRSRNAMPQPVLKQGPRRRDAIYPAPARDELVNDGEY